MLAEARALRARWGGELPAVIGAFIHCVAPRRALAAIRRWGTGSGAGRGGVIALLVWVDWCGRACARSNLNGRPSTHSSASRRLLRNGSPGSAAGQGVSEGPGHRVCLRSFELGKYDVTEWEWQRVMIYFGNADPSYFRGDRQPVEDVSWDASRFLWVMSVFRRRRGPAADWTNGNTRRVPVMRTALFLGRPRRERLCLREDGGCERKASCRLARFASIAIPSKFRDGAGGVAQAEPVGAFDMAGNVFQWVQDCYLDNYQLVVV